MMKARDLFLTEFSFQDDGSHEVHRQIPIEYCEVTDLLEQYGLKPVSVFSNLDKKPIDENTSRYFYVTTAKG
jgi:hypothetical protein